MILEDSSGTPMKADKNSVKWLLPAAIVLATLIVAAVILVRLSGGPASTSLTANIGENFAVLENGDAIMQLSTIAAPSPLSKLYISLYENLGENFKNAYQEGVKQKYKLLTGFDVSFSQTRVEVGAGSTFTISAEATVTQLAKFDPVEGAWVINVKPPDENGREAAGYILMEMMFAQMMLKASPDAERLELSSSVPIKLPNGATILNAGDLNGRTWRLDFGGGSYRIASVSVDEAKSEVLLTERVVVTENPPGEPSENFFSALRDYEVFTIKYRLPGQTTSSTAKGSTTALLIPDFSWTGNGSVSTTFSRTLASGTFSYAGTSAEVILSGRAWFDFGWYIGWDYEWEWTGRWWEYRLQWFKAYVEINPTVEVNENATITGELTYDWSQNLYAWSYPVTVFVGYVPVVIELRVDIGGGVEVGVQGSLSESAGATASAYYKVGVQWTKSSGWDPIAEQSYTLSHTGPDITTSAAAFVSPYLQLRLGAYFYWTAGPFAELKPLAVATFTPDPENWTIEAGFDVNAGVGFGAISEWVDLPDWSTTLYSWRIPIASGTGAAGTMTGQGKLLWRRQMEGEGWSVDISSDGNYVAAGDSTGVVYLLSATGLEIRRYSVEGGVNSIAVSSDGGRIAVGTQGGKIYLFSRYSASPLWVYDAGKAVLSVDLSSDGNYVAAGTSKAVWPSSPGAVYLFSAADNDPIIAYSTEGSFPEVSISSDGSYLAACGFEAGRDWGAVYLFSRSTLLWSYESNYWALSVSISPDGSYIAAGLGRVYLFSRTSHTPLWSCDARGPVSVSVSSDGSRVAAGSGSVYLISGTSGTPIRTWQDFEANEVSISSDGAYVAAGVRKSVCQFSENLALPLWSYETQGYVPDVSMTPDGSYVAAVSHDKHVYLFSRGLD